MFKKILENIVLGAIFFLFVRKMDKENPQLKRISTETKKGKDAVELRPEMPKEGGILTYFPNLKYPFPGFPDTRIVRKVAIAKKLIPYGVNWMHRQIEPFIPKNPKLYCRFVREIYRVANIMIEREENQKMKKKMSKIRDIACVIAEYDDAYRFPAQDGAAEIRIEELGLSDGDKWWFLKKPYNFKGKEEFKKRMEDDKSKVENN